MSSQHLSPSRGGVRRTGEVKSSAGLTHQTGEAYNHYNPKLQPLANANRKKMTKAEACLWKYVLKAKQTGYTFNRQRPVLNFIADFMCKELKLIIEVDGYTHTLPEVIEKDIVRQKKLEQAGFIVIRFKDAEVLNQIQQVRKIIFETIERLKSLPLNPPFEGETQL